MKFLSPFLKASKNAGSVRQCEAPLGLGFINTFHIRFHQLFPETRPEGPQDVTHKLTKVFTVKYHTAKYPVIQLVNNQTEQNIHWQYIHSRLIFVMQGIETFIKMK